MTKISISTSKDQLIRLKMQRSRMVVGHEAGQHNRKINLSEFNTGVMHCIILIRSNKSIEQRIWWGPITDLTVLYCKQPCQQCLKERSRTDSTPNQTTLKLRPGRDHRSSTRQEMLEGINIKDRESCRSVTD